MKHSKLLFALSLLLACSSVYCQSIKLGETLYELNLEWPVDDVKSVNDYKKRTLPNGGKADNFALEHFQSDLSYNSGCPEGQNPDCRSLIPYNPLQIKPADLTYLNTYVGLSDISKSYGGSSGMMKLFFESYKSCCDKKSQSQFFGDMAAAHKKFTIIKTLQSKGIVPSKTKFYTVAQFHNALKDLFGGVKPVLKCSYATGDKYFGYLTGIELSLDENLNVTYDCQKSNGFGYCDSYQNFLYLPL